MLIFFFIIFQLYKKNRAVHARYGGIPFYYNNVWIIYLYSIWNIFLVIEELILTYNIKINNRNLFDSKSL